MEDEKVGYGGSYGGEEKKSHVNGKERERKEKSL
jgi:hypothetical protein